MNDRRSITCPRCGTRVKIPFFWIAGIEGIFRCGGCNLPFKTGYKTGAALFGLSLALSMATVQLLVFLFSAYTLWLFVLLLLPLWILYGFILRKQALLWRARRRLKAKQPE